MSIRDDLNYGLAAFGVQLPATFDLDATAAKLAERPAQNTVAMVTAATVLFYAVEHGRNPKVRDIYDALIYCSTNLSVGYSDIFARTPAGKVIGSALMTFGPSMTAKATDGRKRAEDDDLQMQMLRVLHDIASKLAATRG